MKELFRFLFGNKFTVFGKTFNSKDIIKQKMMIFDVSHPEESLDTIIEVVSTTDELESILDYVRRATSRYGVEISRNINSDYDVTQASIIIPSDCNVELVNNFIANILFGELSCSKGLYSVYFVTVEAEEWKRKYFRQTGLSDLRNIDIESGVVTFNIVKFGYDGKSTLYSQSSQSTTLPFVLEYLKQMFRSEFRTGGSCYTLEVNKEEAEVTIYIFQ